MFGLGFAPDGWDGLRDHLSAQGYDFETQLLAGAIKRNEERGSYYDAFRNRVIVPIRDNMGRIIGFGGRVLDDSQPKYLNTADTPLFKKSHVIFGIDVARDAIRDAGSVIIVEGYMDVIAAHQYGFTNVVACMGTALTSEQLRQLQRYTRKFIFALDADSAGQQATIRGLNQARQGLARVSRPTVRPGGGLRLEQRLGAELFILSMPDGMDPDDVIRRDPERWKALVEQAQPLVDYFFGVIADEYDLSSAGGKAAAVSALAPLIAELNDDIEQQHYVQKLSRLVSVDEMTISGRVRASAATTSLPPGAHLKPRRRPGPAKAPSFDSGPVWNDAPPAGGPPLGDGAPWYDSIGAQPTRAPAPAHQRAHVDQEFYLLASFLRDPDSIIWMTARAHELDIAPPLPQDWQSVENQEIFRALTLYLTGDAQWEPELFREGVAEQLHPRLDRLLGDADRLPDFDREELYPDMLKVLVRIRIDHLKSDNQGIKFAVAEAQQRRRHGRRSQLRRGEQPQSAGTEPPATYVSGPDARHGHQWPCVPRREDSVDRFGGQGARWQSSAVQVAPTETAPHRSRERPCGVRIPTANWTNTSTSARTTKKRTKTSSTTCPMMTRMRTMGPRPFLASSGTPRWKKRSNRKKTCRSKRSSKTSRSFRSDPRPGAHVSARHRSPCPADRRGGT